MNSKSLFWLLATFFLTTAPLAAAQQPTKVPRIGHLTGTLPSANSARREAFRQGLRELGYVEGKNIIIEWRSAEEKLDRLPALAADLVRLMDSSFLTMTLSIGRMGQGRHHRHGWFVTNPCRQGSDDHDSHCDDAGCRSSWKRLRRQPCPTWREHHWVVNPCSGAKRKTTGASEGDRS